MSVFGLQHIGITVPDLDQAVEFFETLFGGVTLLSTGRLEVDDTYMQRKLGVPGPCRVEDIRMLRIGTGGNLELFKYSGDTDPDAELKRNSQPGGFHLAFQVDDAHATAARFRAAGIEVLDGPSYVNSGPSAGLTWCYLRAPWGLWLEIVSVSGPLGHERSGSLPQWWPVSAA